MKEKLEELANGEPGAAAEAVLVGDVMVSDSSSSWTLAMLGDRPELKPPKGPEPPGKVDSAIVEIGWWLCRVFGVERKRKAREGKDQYFGDEMLQIE